MRPTYETDRDTKLERAVIQKVATQFGMTADKLPNFSQVDFALSRGPVVWGVAEVKVRNRLYSQMMLSLHKVQALRDLAATGLQARVIYAVPEGIYVKKIGPEEIDGWIGMGGRTDRGDSQDRELVVYFGDAHINGRLIREEKNPMTKLCDSEASWFR